jgi:hypothetical protein
MKRTPFPLVCFSVVLALTIAGVLFMMDGDFQRWALNEQRTITDGTFENFTIGETKPQALLSIYRTDPITVISPSPVEDFDITARNAANLQLVKYTKGVSLFDYSGTSVHIYFLNGHVYKVDRSYNNQFQQFKVGQTVQQAIVNLKFILQHREGFSVLPIIDYDGIRSYPMPLVLDDTNSKLFNYDAWEFEKARTRPAGAFYTLYFSNQHLYKVKYRRPRVRNDL